MKKLLLERLKQLNEQIKIMIDYNQKRLDSDNFREQFRKLLFEKQWIEKKLMEEKNGK